MYSIFFLFCISGVDEKGRICEAPGPNIRPITGWAVLDNHSVNLLSTILTGIILPQLSITLWPALTS